MTPTIKHEWQRIREHHISPIGRVVRTDENEWEAWVHLNGKRYKVGTENYASREVAEGVVERTWERETKQWKKL